MDATAQSLLVDAWHMFHGNPAPPAGSSAAARLAEAKRWLGYLESPADSNQTVFGQWYGMDHQPWCAMFVAYCDCHGEPTGSFKAGSRYAYVPYILDDARADRNGLTITTTPKAGDLVIYDWENNGEPDHVGLFEGWASDSTFTAVEGNTSIDNNSNGGEVMRRTRTADSSVDFVRVAA